MHAALALSFFEVASKCSVMDKSDILRSLLVIALAFGLIWFAFRSMVWKVEPSPANLGNFIAFNAVVMGVLGGAVVVMASKQWPIALLAAGCCLGVGFLIGLLFGYPMSDSGDASKSKNLLQQSVDALSKILAGATLVKAKAVFSEFQQVANAISQYGTAGSCGGDGSWVFGAAVTGYFLLLGFLSALLLSNTYHLVTPVPGSVTDQVANANKGVQPASNAAPNDPDAPPSEALPVAKSDAPAAPTNGLIPPATKQVGTAAIQPDGKDPGEAGTIPAEDETETLKSGD